MESQLINVTKANVQSTQEIVELILDSNRNALLALDLKVRLFCQKNEIEVLMICQVSIGTMGLGSGALVAGLFGMNVCGCQISLTLSVSDSVG